MPKRIYELTEETSPVGSDALAVDRSGRSEPVYVEIDTILDRLGLGWAYYDDSTYTSGSPLTSNNAKTQILIDGVGGDTVTSQLPSGVTALWDAASDSITGVSEGDSLLVRLDITCAPASVNDFAELVFDIGSGSPIEIGRDTIRFSKTGSTRFLRTYDLFCGSTFAANGCKIYFDTSVSGDSIDIYDLGVKITRTYKARS